MTEETHFLDELAAEIRKQAESGAEELSMGELLAKAPWSRRQTERLFRDRYLTSPQRYFRDHQANVAERLLNQGYDVLSAAAASGFASAGRLHEALVTRRGLTPGELRRRGEGVTIRYGLFETQLGVTLVAATPRGLCSLRLCQYTGAEVELADLKNSLPNATYCEDPNAVQSYADHLVAWLDQRVERFDPPIDVLLGTTFQREVWAELQKLKPGETVSYTELAARVGRPSAVRAVANACALNNLAIAIPCHRAVRSDGALAGYRWGITWKQRLLEIERRMAAAETAAARSSQPELF